MNHKIYKTKTLYATFSGAAYGEDCSGEGVTCADANNICDTSDTNLCICNTGYYRKTNAAECAERKSYCYLYLCC